MIPRLRLEYPPADILDAAQKVARFMAENNVTQLVGLQRATGKPLNAEQVDELRGLISYHARCQHNLGSHTFQDDEEMRRLIVREAAKAQQAVYSYLNSLKAKP